MAKGERKRGGKKERGEKEKERDLGWWREGEVVRPVISLYRGTRYVAIHAIVPLRNSPRRFVCHACARVYPCVWVRWLRKKVSRWPWPSRAGPRVCVYEARVRTRFARGWLIRALWTARREKSKISRSSEEKIVIQTIGAKWKIYNGKNRKMITRNLFYLFDKLGD